MSDEQSEVEKLRAALRDQEQFIDRLIESLGEKDHALDILAAGIARHEEVLTETSKTLHDVLEDEERRAAEDATRPPSTEAVIKRYYRRHARNPKITLKQVCEEMGANYNSIRAAKYHYDKRRKRRHSD